jgi:hypothetical protein
MEMESKKNVKLLRLVDLKTPKAPQRGIKDGFLDGLRGKLIIAVDSETHQSTNQAE